MITSCQQINKEQSAYDMADFEEEIALMAKESWITRASTPSTDIIETFVIDKKKINKDGQLGITVTELEKAKPRIDTFVKKNGGFYAIENFTNTD
jgi:hypothetical protein